jgi:hypothetical protein
MTLVRASVAAAILLTLAPLLARGTISVDIPNGLQSFVSHQRAAVVFEGDHLPLRIIFGSNHEERTIRASLMDLKLRSLLLLTPSMGPVSRMDA